ncbi:MAG: inositol monophosphatase [Cytophagales bacterium]|nr:inositol monophosphatase [Cytophagales bacterium]
MDLSRLCNETVELAQKVGGFIADEATNFDLSKVEMKGFNDLVSYVDKEAEKQLVAGLQEILPEAGFITEEGTAGHDNEEYKWIIDPLDGTTNFTHGIPAFAISIALAKGEELLVGVVYEVSRKECFYAWKEGGAYLNGNKISVSKADSLSKSLLATGFPYYMFDKLDRYVEILKEFMQKTHGIRRIGSAAVDLCYVACGRMEAYYEFNLNAYDIAGGAMIVQEAGGHVSDFGGGNNFFYGEEIVASNSKIHQEVLTEIQKHW